MITFIFWNPECIDYIKKREKKIKTRKNKFKICKRCQCKHNPFISCDLNFKNNLTKLN